MTACFITLVSCGRWGLVENDDISMVDEDSVNSAEGRFGKDGFGLAVMVIDWYMLIFDSTVDDDHDDNSYADPSP